MQENQKCLPGNKHKLNFHGLWLLFLILTFNLLSCQNTIKISDKKHKIGAENKKLSTADDPAYKIKVINIYKQDICPDTCTNIIYDLSYPKFTGDQLPDLLIKANTDLPEVVQNIVFTVKSFNQFGKKTITNLDTGYVKIYFYNYYSGNTFISFQLEPSSSNYIRPGSFPLYCFNFNLTENLSLTADSCFKLKTTPEEWISFVNNRPCPDCNWRITTRAFLPLYFLADEEGVQFFFDYNDISNITFSWSEIGRFFEIKNIPEELYL